MSYNDDEELQIGEFKEEDVLDLDLELDEPLDPIEELDLGDDEEEADDEFASIDGSIY